MLKLGETYCIEFFMDLKLESGMGPGPDTSIESFLNIFSIKMSEIAKIVDLKS